MWDAMGSAATAPLAWTPCRLHNPLKNPERYLLYGAISARMAEEMRKPEVWLQL